MLVLYWDFWWIMDMITEKLSKIFRFCCCPFPEVYQRKNRQSRNGSAGFYRMTGSLLKTLENPLPAMV